MSGKSCGCSGGCGCDGGSGPVPNLPGQRELRWRAAPHGAALSRMREWLADERHALELRSLAHQGTDDPSIALLDAWAVVTDAVSFYTERIAQEGFLRTATEAGSVRQHARSLGYELRPGVAAKADLVFTAETAEGAPASVLVPAGTPVQTIPAPGALPQTFETVAELEVRGAWNEIPTLDREPQGLGFGTPVIWLDTTTSAVQKDDLILVVGAERAGVGPTPPPDPDPDEQWDFRRVTAVEVDPRYASGWTKLTLDRPLGYRPGRPLVARRGLHVHRFTRRLNLFGWNAQDPALFIPPGEPSERKEAREALWDGYDEVGSNRELEIDGDVPEIQPGSWLVLEQVGRTEAFEVVDVTPDGLTKFGLSGRITRVEVDYEEHLGEFRRNQAIVHAVTEELPAALMPLTSLVGGPGVTTIEVAQTDPPLAKDRLVVVTGVTEEGEESAQAVVVTAVLPVPGRQRLTLADELEHRYHAGTVRVRGNVARATHGETVQQVLGSGDRRDSFPSYTLRRPPLTYIPSSTSPTGAVAALEVRVEDVAWTEVPTLFGTRPTDQVYIVRQDEEGVSRVTFGDGIHGSRLPTGVENVRATYRVGLGADGESAPGQIMLPVHKPRGIASVTNLLPSRDWAPPEDLEQARTNAPQRIRTLDRAVSVDDYADFARGFSGVGRARADLVWDGRVDTVVLSVLAANGGAASTTLLGDLRDAIDDARDHRAPRTVIAGQVIDVAVQLTVDVDPRYEKDDVQEAVVAALLATFGGLDLAAPLAASTVLVRAAEVEGVRSATMPELSAPGVTGATPELVAAEPARWGVDPATPTAGPVILPAQALRLASALVQVEV